SGCCRGRGCPAGQAVVSPTGVLKGDLFLAGVFRPRDLSLSLSLPPPASPLFLHLDLDLSGLPSRRTPLPHTGCVRPELGVPHRRRRLRELEGQEGGQRQRPGRVDGGQAVRVPGAGVHGAARLHDPRRGAVLRGAVQKRRQPHAQDLGPHRPRAGGRPGPTLHVRPPGRGRRRRRLRSRRGQGLSQGEPQDVPPARREGAAVAAAAGGSGEEGRLTGGSERKRRIVRPASPHGKEGAGGPRALDFKPPRQGFISVTQTFSAHLRPGAHIENRQPRRAPELS
ncbi:MAG: hypothetical protein BJ554DRAFT_2812, partial [Olpidium bornovanus]